MYFLKQQHADQLKFRSGADGVRDSEFTNKLERKTHCTELRIRRVSPCFVEAASAKADLFSQSDNENRPIKMKPKRLFFATG